MIERDMIHQGHTRGVCTASSVYSAQSTGASLTPIQTRPPNAGVAMLAVTKRRMQFLDMLRVARFLSVDQSPHGCTA
jgi:hypothetical protein